MSIADKYFKEEVKDILENGFSDEGYQVMNSDFSGSM